jgi:hypothetical protein
MRKLEENLALLELTRAKTLAMVRGLSQEQMDWRPAVGKWSVGENLDHLLRSESIYRREITALVDLAKAGKTPFIRRTVQDIDFAPSFLPKSMLPLVDIPFTVITMFVPPAMRDMMIKSTAVLTGQSPKAALPEPGRPAGVLIAEMEAALVATTAILRENPDLNYDAMKTQHPMLGINSVPQLLRLTALHEGRHQQQMGKVLASMPAMKAA